MSAAPHMTLDARAERRAMLALVAVFALLFQALVPSIASASAGAGAAPICRPLAAASGADEPSAPPGPGQPCQHCVCPAIAAEPPPALSILRVAYVTAAAPAPPPPRILHPPARAPPRPPGQGPPGPNA